MAEHAVGAIPCLRDNGQWRCDGRAVISDQPAASWHAACLSAAGYAVVAVPEGVEVAHGARLVSNGWCSKHCRTDYAIEDTP